MATSPDQGNEALAGPANAARVALAQAINELNSGTGTRDAVEAALRALAPDEIVGEIYVAKVTDNGVLNQVWQGKSVTERNDAMIFIASSLNPGDIDRIQTAAEGRLNPSRDAGGLESAVLASTDGGDCRVEAVVEYDHRRVGEHLRAQIQDADFPIVKVPFIGKAEPFAGGHVPTGTAELSVEELRLHLTEALNVVLEGPPGTGKTHMAEALIDGFEGAERLDTVLAAQNDPTDEEPLKGPSLVWEMVQFHPSYAYEDFVRGLRTKADGSYDLAVVEGILPAMCEVAAARGDKPTLLIIDEINRADVASVFGETIFAIDPSHRNAEVRLRDSGEGAGRDSLAVPANLYILATMNTADRSISKLDVAIRRRFRFLEMAPSQEALKAYYKGDEHAFAKAVALMEAVGGAVEDRDLKPGHSYFMAAAATVADWRDAMIDKMLYEVRPLLEEYSEEGRAVRQVMLPGATDLDLVTAEPEAIREHLATWLELDAQ